MNQMKINVKTGKWAARFIAEPEVVIDIPESSTVADVVAVLNIPADEAGLTVINGVSVNKDYILSDDDSLIIHPIIIGG